MFREITIKLITDNGTVQLLRQYPDGTGKTVAQVIEGVRETCKARQQTPVAYTVQLVKKSSTRHKWNESIAEYI